MSPTPDLGLLRLAHVALRSPDPERLAVYYERNVGLVRVDGPDDAIRLTTDAQPHCLELHEGDQRLDHIAFEVTDVDAAAGALADTAAVTTEGVDSPGYASAIAFTDPEANTVRLVAGAQPSTAVAASSRVFRPRKIGHVGVKGSDLAGLVDFYTTHVGFRLSDWIGEQVVFLRCNPEHHALVFVAEAPEVSSVHHVAYEVPSWEGFADQADILAANGVERRLGSRPPRAQPELLHVLRRRRRQPHRVDGRRQAHLRRGRPRAARIRPHAADDVERLGPAAAAGVPTRPGPGEAARPGLMERFAGQVAIVTGAGGAIGAEIAARLGSEGARLTLGDLDAEALERTAAALRERVGGEKPVLVAGDLSDPAAGTAIVGACTERFGRVDVLVNNAGGGIIRPTLEQTEETLHATLDRNIWSAMRCTLAALPVMREAGYGRIVFTGADSVRNGLDNHAVYNAAKGGVHAFARGLAREFAHDGITVNTVAPCATATPELAQIMADDPSLGEAFTRIIPIGRPAALDEVASAVAYLASEEARFITGQVARGQRRHDDGVSVSEPSDIKVPQLPDSTVVIAGGTSGVGLAAAHRFLAAGGAPPGPAGTPSRARRGGGHRAARRPSERPGWRSVPATPPSWPR